MNIRNTFLAGRMDLDSDNRLIGNGLYRIAENIRVANSEGSDVGAIEKINGNVQLTNFAFGDNPETIAQFEDVFGRRIYWWVVSDSGSYVCEYDKESSLFTYVLADTRVGNLNILGFDRNYLITGINLIINSDNGDRLLAWTDNNKSPKIANVERAKAYGLNGFDEADISVIKAPPLFAPSINLSETEDEVENNIEERFLRFAYRYRYLDDELSAFSPFTETAFIPKVFQFDYSISSNESMVNNYNMVNIEFNTGPSIVKGIDILFKESGSNNTNLIKSFDKEEEGWGDNTNVNFDFSNNKLYQVLSEFQLFRLCDFVPLKAKAQEVIGNRLIYGNYTEGYNLVDCDNNKLPIIHTLEKVTTAINDLLPAASLKSNRDYEIGRVYIDDFGRMTTVLDSNENTIYFSNAECVTQNQIKVVIQGKAPCFAKYFRFFIKQSKNDYDVLVPTLFYQDGVYVWIKLEGNEGDKIDEGDFVYVKADTQEILSTIKQTKILEIKDQERNFLEDGTVTTLEQLPGKYFRIKPTGFRINEEDFTNYETSSYDTSKNKHDDPISGATFNVIEDAIYYGVTGLNDMTSGGTYSGTSDTRYRIQIHTTGATDTYKWSTDEGATWDDNTGAGYSITGAAQVIELGITVTFGAITGHDTDDYWVVSAKYASHNGLGGDENSKAYALLESVDDDVIEGGARITITYDESYDTIQFVQLVFISSRRYANLEEWFFGDNIDEEFDSAGIDSNRYWFRRGTVTKGSEGSHYFTQDNAGRMVLIIRSLGTQNNDVDSITLIRASLSIFQSERNIILETKPINENEDVYFEIGRTYNIDQDGYHLGYDGSDVDQTAIANGEFLLPVFNCYAWGNGFESYKVKDLFNAKGFKIDTRPLTSIDDYKENTRIASKTYSQLYEQTTNYNGLNEFNLARTNFKDLDDQNGSIQKLYTEDTDLIVFQEHKIFTIPFQKDILYTADGQGSVTQSNKVLGQERPFAGEFGISKNPESFAVYGFRKWFTDANRGAVLRLSIDGLTEISNYGLRDWFRDWFRDNPKTKLLGAYDAYHDQYVLHLDDTPIASPFSVKCGTTINAFKVSEELNYTVNLNTISGDVYLNYNITGTIDVVVNNGSDINFSGLTGTGQVTFNQSTPINTITITITAVSELPSFNIGIPCIIEEVEDVIANDDSLSIISGNDLDINVLANDLFIDPVTVTITTPAVEGTATVNPDKTINYAHDGLNTNADSFIYQIDDGNSTDTATVSITVKATGGGGGATGEAFNISSDSYYSGASNGEGACGFILDDTKYHDGVFTYPTLADYVYNDVDKLLPFNGYNKYWRIELGRTIKIGTDGQVLDVWICGAGNA